NDPEFEATVELDNSGDITGSVVANANASGTAGTEDASAFAVLGGTGASDAGIYQEANGSTVSLTNSGMIDFDASATAVASGTAFGFALADGIDQVASGSSALASLVNGTGGSITVDAAAVATGGDIG